MEHFPPSLKAKELAGYVKAVYGDKHLGILRLLSSVPYFREAVVNDRLEQLVGMPLVSFEKYLRETHGIFYRYDGATFLVERIAGGGSVELGRYDDDVVFSIGGAVVAGLREMYPDGNAFSGCPLVSLGRGRSVASILAGINIQGVRDYLAECNAELFSDDYSTLNNYQELVDGKQEIPSVLQYQAVEALHRVFVELRRNPISVTSMQPLPDCPDDKFMQAITGTYRATFRPPPGGKYPDIIKQALEQAYADGTWVGEVYQLCGQVEVDPFSFIGSVSVEVVLPDVTAELPAQVEVVKIQRNAPIDIHEPILHVNKYIDTDINNLTLGEREIALYGFPGGQAAFNQISKGVLKKLPQVVGPGTHNARDVLNALADVFRTSLRTKQRDLSEAHYLLMAAGRITAWKGNWTIESDDLWHRVR